MRISKSMFKNLTRCPNFCALYDMYTFRSQNHVKSIDGIDVTDIYNMPEGQFVDEKEEVQEVFAHMFDEETGDDLTVITDSQMEAMSAYFTETEQVAARAISKLFDGQLQYGSTIKEQKLFSFDGHSHSYYCYLDGYLENDDFIGVFEVKATTSNKFIKLGKAPSKTDDERLQNISKEDEYESIFVRGPKNILYLREDILGNVETERLSAKDYQKQREKLFNRYGSDGTGKYVFDLAVERYIIEHSLKENGQSADIDKIRYFLVVLTGDYVFDGIYQGDKPVYEKDDSGRDIVTLIDMTTITKEYQPIIEDMRLTMEKNINDMSVTNDRLGTYCEYKKSTQCKFKPVCFKNVTQKGSILEFIDHSKAFSVSTSGKPKKRERLTIYELINQGMHSITDVPFEYLDKHYNIIQYQCYQNKHIYMQKEKIGQVLNDLQYPLYHLDFESFGCPLPRFKGEKPYSQSLFQFSLHIEKDKGQCDKVHDHHDFLAKDHHDHREELVQELVKLIDLSKGGTIIVYNQNFEKTRLKELALLFPQYAEDLLNIRDHIFDLLHVLEGNKKMFLPYANSEWQDKEADDWASEINYYNNHMGGSYSIKKILPLFSDLSYKTLTVKNGTEAVLVYSQLPQMTENEYERLYLALRKYCQQDTWAMVEILWGLQKAVQNK